MTMKSLLILLLVATTTAFAQRQCCYPDQFESSLARIVASVVSGQGSATHDLYQLAYDFNNRRLGAITYREDMGVLTKFQYIQDFNKGVEYEIQVKPQVSFCSKSMLNGTFPHCIPASATYLGSFYYGDRQLNVDSFRYFESMGPTNYLNVTAAVTQEDCIPVSIDSDGMRNGVPTVFVNGYANYTSGIADPSKYFTVPSFCPQSINKIPKMRKQAFDKILP